MAVTAKIYDHALTAGGEAVYYSSGRISELKAKFFAFNYRGPRGSQAAQHANG